MSKVTGLFEVGLVEAVVQSEFLETGEEFAAFELFADEVEGEVRKPEAGNPAPASLTSKAIGLLPSVRGIGKRSVVWVASGDCRFVGFGPSKVVLTPADVGASLLHL